ncbi:3-methyladenine DNA glycosylase [Gordonia sp. ABSL1-1]|uniref:3-methyladenine DNA glycosylase n=1 Tax=Gordonia sp. ABSL1-1 TaxID=3053923 RepID=UPI002573B62F|nr:3-methyladenine DNA glycosylase [Gordonia sp. ABSL1-1]MDL9937257.1 3-methyladenine DNA glycosylase [Gordonia sp. ABSL1-1]
MKPGAQPDVPVLHRDVWQARRAEHQARVETLVGPYLRARRSGRTHPVLDFLFTYYSSRPSHVRRWHPGYGTVLADADTDFTGLRGYARVPAGMTVSLDYLRSRRGALATTAALLRATAARPPRFGCFGLHEWAMVYRSDDVRHALPLRLGSAGTDAVVESMPLRCTHFDAFRFFTDPARPLNATQPTRDGRVDDEQPGCLHTTMDLYRTCFTLSPLLDATLTVDAFEIALDARILDMRASPYDLTGLDDALDIDTSPVRIETAVGRAEYARAQTEVADRGAVMRTRILHACESLSAIAAD